MDGSSSQLSTDRVYSPINAFSLKELYMLDVLDSLKENTGLWQAPNPYEVLVEHTTEEEITLCKGFLVVSENNKHGNLRKQCGFWCEVLSYMKSKTQQYGRRTYDMYSDVHQLSKEISIDELKIMMQSYHERMNQQQLFISKLIQQKLQNEYAQPFSAIAITFDLPTVEPEDSLRMRDEHLDTNPETESDEFIKSSVKNLIPSPSESEDLSNSECDVHAFDDFTTFSNLLFDADEDFSSSDDESFSDEDILKKIYSNPLFDKEVISMKIDPNYFNAESDLIEYLLNHDSSIISSSSKIDSLLDEFAGELILLKTIPPGIDETYCDPEEEIRLI
uniref:Uncharacterized protein n=1 Tax=Tanacetum cinerariifolium TaxID=118510 RepID=A0A699HML1_TANCI|nr:hypothetical protein [Tanacetum cinerariifolium]